jgi:NAD-dependent dihydropyrimidine dehydrogenase PreA subunit
MEVAPVTYVITEPCVGTLDTACADVCPVDCIHPGPGEEGRRTTTILYVDPTECIDCDACLEACPVDAPIPEEDVPERWAIFTEINRVYYEDGHEAGERMLHEYLARTAGT